MFVLLTVVAAGHLHVESASKDAIRIEPTRNVSVVSYANISESASPANVTNRSRATVNGVLAAGHLRVESASKEAIQIDPRGNVSVVSYANTSASKSAANVTKKRAAIVLFGNSYRRKCMSGCKVGKPVYYVVDFRESISNYQKYMFSYLAELGFDIDVFLCTNTMQRAVLKELIQAYEPVDYMLDDGPKEVYAAELREEESEYADEDNDFTDDDVDIVRQNEALALMGRRYKLMTAVKLCADHQAKSQQAYDRVLITRFDLYFQENFANSSIEWDKINVVSELEHAGLIDDNFYAMPGSLLPAFQKSLTLTWGRDGHSLLKPLVNASDGRFHTIDDSSKGQRVKAQRWYRIVHICSNGQARVDTTYIAGSCNRPSRFACNRGCLKHTNITFSFPHLRQSSINQTRTVPTQNSTNSQGPTLSRDPESVAEETLKITPLARGEAYQEYR